MKGKSTALLVVLLASGCVGGNGTGDIPGIEVGMTRAEVRGILGSPDEEHIYQLFSRDSVLWSLADSSEVPGHVSAPGATDAELSRTVASGDTVVTHIEVWNSVGLKMLLKSYEYTITYEVVRGEWRVVGAKRRNEALAY